MARFSMAMLVCSNLGRSRDFYRNVLLLKLNQDAAPHWVDFELATGQRLSLHPATESLPVRPGSLQLAFSVDNVDACVADARLQGTRILQEPYEAPEGRFAVLADPDGYAVQIGSAKRA